MGIAMTKRISNETIDAALEVIRLRGQSELYGKLNIQWVLEDLKDARQEIEDLGYHIMDLSEQ